MQIKENYYLIIDLEATCTNDGSFPRTEMEIIEIGAVLQDAVNFEVVSEFQTFVRPVRHPVLTEFCTQLTSITQPDLADAPTFPEALAAMIRWRSGFAASLFCSWGDYDRKQFLQDCNYHHVGYPFHEGHLNLKTEFSTAMNLRRRLGVGQALQYLKMTFAGTPHRGLDDARNIARIVRKIGCGV
jgi:inhibitor of KinA sporulation pathway (predicted exonuclease)